MAVRVVPLQNHSHTDPSIVTKRSCSVSEVASGTPGGKKPEPEIVTVVPPAVPPMVGEMLSKRGVRMPMKLKGVVELATMLR